MRPTALDLPRELPREPAGDALAAAGHDDPVSLLQGAVNDRNAALQAAREAEGKVAAAAADATAARADLATMTQARTASEVERDAAKDAYVDMAEKLAAAHAEIGALNTAAAAKDGEIAHLTGELKLAQDELASTKEKLDALANKKPAEGPSE